MGNHDYGATGSAEPTRFGEPGSCAVRSIELARERLSGADVQWMRSRKPAARRGDVQCWHGSPRNAVHEYVGASNAAACLAVQRGELGLVGHTHVAAAWRQHAGRRERDQDRASAYRWISPAASGCSTQARLVRRRRRGSAGGTRWTSKRLTARTGCCSIFSGRRRPGAARRMTRLRRACGRARSASTMLRGRSAIRGVEPPSQRVAAGQRDFAVGGHPVANAQLADEPERVAGARALAVDGERARSRLDPPAARVECRQRQSLVGSGEIERMRPGVSQRILAGRATARRAICRRRPVLPRRPVRAATVPGRRSIASRARLPRSRPARSHRDRSRTGARSPG